MTPDALSLIRSQMMGHCSAQFGRDAAWYCLLSLFRKRIDAPWSEVCKSLTNRKNCPPHEALLSILRQVLTQGDERAASKKQASSGLKVVAEQRLAGIDLHQKR